MVLIEIPMPKDCYECPCCRHDSYDGNQAFQCNLTLKNDIYFSDRPEWCPLKEVQE